MIAVVNCRQLVTLGGIPGPRAGSAMRELGIVENGALLVRDGLIAAAGPIREVEPLIGNAEVVDAGGRIVLPGFVDAHTHPVFAGNRAAEFEMRCQGSTYREIAESGGGIRSTVRATREAGELQLTAVARRYRDWFLRGGTTTVEAKTGYGLSPEAELKLLRVIAALDREGPLRYVPTFLGAHEIPDEYRGRTAAYVDSVIHEMLPLVRAQYCDVFCEPGVFPLEEARRVLLAAKAAGFGLRVHADQFTADYGSQLAAECGALTADHLEYTTNFAPLHGLFPILLPASVYALGQAKYPDARGMIASGLPVVLATDFNPGSSPTTSMRMVLSLACTQMKMTPAEAITAATINAACSLGLGGEIGSLQPGKRADFAIHDCQDYRELPYFFGSNETFRTFCGGRLS